MGQYTNKEITARLVTLNGGTSSSTFNPIGRQLETVPITDVSGNNGDFFYDENTSVYFKSNDIWLVMDASNAF